MTRNSNGVLELPLHEEKISIWCADPDNRILEQNFSIELTSLPHNFRIFYAQLSDNARK